MNLSLPRATIVAVVVCHLLSAPRIAAQRPDLSYRGLYAGMSVKDLATYLRLPGGHADLRSRCTRMGSDKRECHVWLYRASLRSDRSRAELYVVLASDSALVVESLVIDHHMPDTLVVRQMFELVVSDWERTHAVNWPDRPDAFYRPPACSLFAWIDRPIGHYATVSANCVPMMDGEPPRLTVVMRRSWSERKKKKRGPSTAAIDDDVPNQYVSSSSARSINVGDFCLARFHYVTHVGSGIVRA